MEDRDVEEQFVNSFVDKAEISEQLNVADTLPFAYHHPTEHKIYWMCNFDARDRIIGVFGCQGESDKQINEFKDMSEAIHYRDVLISEGWKPIETPNITFSYPNMPDRHLTRKEKRKVGRKLNRLIEQRKTQKMRKAFGENNRGRR